MFTLNCKGRLLLIDKPMVMGVINITPDSFYSGSRAPSSSEWLEIATGMVSAGVSIIDIGGQSTRPQSTPLTVQEELERIIPCIKILHDHFPGLIISIDTYFARVAAEAVGAGASMVNDISGGQLDPGMFETVAKLMVPYICMHMKGRPENMQEQAVYTDVVKEVLDFFISRIGLAKDAGIHDLIIDPGFGFAKTRAHNFTLLKNLHTFKMLDRPILAGLSRKSTIYRTLGITAENALNGTTVLNTIALMNGADILRVHDVREAVEAVTLFEAYKQTAMSYEP